MVLDHPYPPDLRVENEARTLVGAGHEVTLLQVSADARPALDRHEGTRVVRRWLPRKAVGWLCGFAGVTPVPDWVYSRLIRQEHARWPFDALHVHDLYLVGGGLRAARRLGVPLVADLHENWVEALGHYAWSTRPPGKYVVHIPTWERVERDWVNRADRLVVPIEEAARRYRALGVPEERIAVVPNTVELDSFEGYPLEPDVVERTREGGTTFVYTGHVDAHRGLATVVDAMPAVVEAVPGARLVVVGDGATLGELRAQAAALGLGGRVRFEGRVPQARVKSYLAGADVALVPHLKTAHTDHTIPHKLFHAMLMGAPVLVSDCDPLERIVGAERCGAVFRSGDAADFARAAVALARDADGRRAMGERGRAAVLARYHWDATARPLLDLYAALAPAGADR